MYLAVSAIGNSTDFLSAILTSDFSALASFQTWSDAVSYVLFSLSLADGGVIKIASHHHFDNNLILDALFAIGADILATFIYLIVYVVSTGWVLCKFEEEFYCILAYFSSFVSFQRKYNNWPVGHSW